LRNFKFNEFAWYNDVKSNSWRCIKVTIGFCKLVVKVGLDVIWCLVSDPKLDFTKIDENWFIVLFPNIHRVELKGKEFFPRNQYFVKLENFDFFLKKSEFLFVKIRFIFFLFNKRNIFVVPTRGIEL
jgi:hypothetical protein